MTARHIAAVGAALLALVAAACHRGAEGGSEETATALIAEHVEEPLGDAEHAAADEPSDLDQPVTALLASVCEHEILTHTCAECRYEVGVAEVDPALLDPTRGGQLTTYTLAERPLGAVEQLNGEVRLNEERAVWISPRTAGAIRTIRVDLGDRIQAGQVLLEVESAELRQAKADLARARAAVTLGEAEVARESDLFERKICPRKDLLEAEARLAAAQAEERAATGLLLAFGLSPDEVETVRSGVDHDPSGLLPVRAPFAGTILERSLSLGALATPGDRLLLLADTSTMWVMTTVHESQVAALGQSGRSGPVAAEVVVAAFPGQVFRGRVEKVGGTIDETTRTATARVVVDNPGGLLRAGMFARVRLALAEARSGVAVPEEAVLEDEGRTFVFKRATGSYFVRRPVTTGRSAEGWVEVQGEIGPGDEVVTRGAFLLKSDVLRSKMGAGCAD